MGEAKRRGTLEQRAAEGAERKRREEVERALRRSRMWSKLTPAARAAAILALAILPASEGERLP